MKIKINCPICKKTVFTHDNKGTMIIYGKCKKCNKMVYYDPVKKECWIKQVPQRNTISGKRYI